MKNLQFKPLPMTEDVPLTSNLIANNPAVPDPEVKATKPRRRFTARYKLGILAEIDACTSKGQIGAILRREGLYSSNLTTWRRQREEGILNGLSPRKRGRKAKEINPLAKRVAELERENRKLDKKLKQAEIIIEFQKKISQMLNLGEQQ
jgi:transposase-like protein